MRKKQEQTSGNLQNKNLKSEFDWKGISSYVKEYTDAIVDEIRPIYDSSKGLSYNDFGVWIEDGIGAGDLVTVDEDVYVVGKSTPGYLDLIANIKLGSKDFECAYHNCVNKTNKKVEADKAAKLSNEFYEEVNQIIKEINLQFDIVSHQLIERYEPAPKDRVVFYGNGLSGMGIMRYANPEKDMFEMYCYSLDDKAKTTKHSMHEVFKNYHDFVFSPMTRNEYLQLSRRLLKCNKVWNDRLGRIEPVGYEVEEGQPYWYFNEALKVESCDNKKANRRTADRKRGGNQFKNLDDAMEIQRELIEIIQKRLAQ